MSSNSPPLIWKNITATLNNYKCHAVQITRFQSFWQYKQKQKMHVKVALHVRCKKLTNVILWPRSVRSTLKILFKMRRPPYPPLWVGLKERFTKPLKDLSLFLLFYMHSLLSVLGLKGFVRCSGCTWERYTLTYSISAPSCFYSY